LRVKMLENKIPKERLGSIPHNGSRVFCGSFSKEGNVYMSASQGKRSFIG